MFFESTLIEKKREIGQKRSKKMVKKSVFTYHCKACLGLYSDSYSFCICSYNCRATDKLASDKRYMLWVENLQLREKIRLMMSLISNA